MGQGINAKNFFKQALLCLFAFAWFGPTPSYANFVFQSTVTSDSLLPICETELQSKRILSEIQKLKIITFNVENLIYYPNILTEDGQGHFSEQPDPRNKSPLLLQRLADSINDLDPDFAVLQEVRSADAARRFIETYLDNRYDVHLIPGHGERQIHIAFLTKKDFPAEYEISSNRAETWIDPLHAAEGPEPLFTMDVPVLKVFVTLASGDRFQLLSLAGIHNRSKRNRPGDPESRLIRHAQAQREVIIWNRMAGEMQPIPRVIMAGDFNATRDRDHELDPLDKIDAIDGLQANALNQKTEHRVTHTYHPKEGATHASEFDYILISRVFQSIVNRSFVYRYRHEETGEELPIPHNFEMREANPSNHFPKYLEIRLQDLIQMSTGLTR